MDGLPFIGADRLIALKADAWLDLNKRKQQGVTINSKIFGNIKMIYSDCTGLPNPAIRYPCLKISPGVCSNFSA
jgi:hypothetical protein